MRQDAVTPELHEQVLLRDRYCFVLRVDPDHRCCDRWGRPHPATDRNKLTVDHVWSDGGHMGDRAPSDLRHLVAMCAKENIGGPSRLVRQAEREYLKSLYGE